MQHRVSKLFLYLHYFNNLIDSFRTYFFYTLIFLFPCLSYATNQAEQPVTSLKVVTEALPPFQMINDDGQLDGYSIELVRHLLKRSNIEAQIEVLPWQRAYRYSQEKKNVIIFSTGRTKEREDLFHWVGLLHSQELYFFRLATNKVDDSQGLESLKKYNVGVTSNYPSDEFLKSHQFPNVERLERPNKTVKMLFENRIDLILINSRAMRKQIKQYGFKYEDVEIVTKVPTISGGLYIAMSKDSDLSLVARLRQNYNDMRVEGVIDKIKKRWSNKLR